MEHEVIVFCEGDSSTTAPWSTVPYYLTKTLEKKNFKVNRVDIYCSSIIARIFAKTVRIIFKNTYSYDRTSYYRHLVKRKMRKAISKYPNSELLISTNFSFSGSAITKKIPSLLFGDWTYEYLITKLEGREPEFFEKGEIKRQLKNIEESNFVITLFPKICKYMQKRYKNKNIYYFGNVINSEFESIDESVIEKKIHSDELLFIGKPNYMAALKTLIASIDNYNKRFKTNILLNVIGIDKFETEKFSCNIKFFGYLDKNNSTENKIYCELLKKSKVCINTSEIWAGFSSFIEAMYYYTPIITGKYDEMIETFGDAIQFGYYCEKNDPNLLESYIERILELPDEVYKNMCLNAHINVKEFTWDAFSENLIKLVYEQNTK